MSFFTAAFQPSACWHASVKKIQAFEPKQLRIMAALLLALLLRLLPASYLAAPDRLLGRPGDCILFLFFCMLLVIVALHRAHNQAEHLPTQALPDPAIAASVANVLDRHLQLDGEIDNKLMEVVADTETSALEIIHNVRQLYDTASTLVNYLDHSNMKGSSLEKEIVSSVAFIVEIGSFVEQMPAKIARDLENVQNVATEIKAMSGLVQAVHDISMQSHLLAVNAAIEASRAGAAGAAFRAVANEMRILATNSEDVAKKIHGGLSRARHVLEHGIASSIASSAQELEQVGHAVESIRKIQDNFEDISQYYKTRFLVVTKHNVDLAKSIGDALGTIQYQDVVRQCVDRIRHVIGQRNHFLKTTVGQLNVDKQPATLLELPDLLEMIRLDYLEEENKHKHSARHALSTELKIELF
ncbi:MULTISPECIES: methyl-accepting chemotaxis protein [unclassified Undibacterium]|uniref:methyl-accepting chemotaxis protein n=1 Tax=unclassified Undibacterium TaxID=2630295 RepID=UPI002AC93E6D|nr:MULTISPECIES: methyl-accepting chemotaxis protein [unclassified Undibacterium]MEB0140160.1 methyl-accepting chemotaxis protein [Undibacterium sp. CCC2.1]MEB0172466.1 methyl-accepting chemotaxis protein [Undibacterium sp. CCC1.1]MEB0176984.1 methyl-accepting chemotaxis protein [Undibacterium sp. CCC3.4]MEB0215588.1 methyl-accepting chemotaxis protein [Undibacterium sp. 5I2]WPX43705.1 methyl-accepting chemotaxis protein [Undibacterium sp. CCC3.4]